MHTFTPDVWSMQFALLQHQLWLIWFSKAAARKVQVISWWSNGTFIQMQKEVQTLGTMWPLWCGYEKSSFFFFFYFRLVNWPAISDTVMFGELTTDSTFQLKMTKDSVFASVTIDLCPPNLMSSFTETSKWYKESTFKSDCIH